MAGIFKNIVTFGAAGRIDAEQGVLDDQIREFNEFASRVEKRRETMEASIQRLVDAKVQAVGSLRELRKLSDSLSVRERELAEHDFAKNQNIDLQSFDMAEATLTAGETAINAARGLGTGASTALGAWALVAGYGTASTGTAISALSGAAATNATLAALGGGSLAAGGGGIAAGTAVLGGLVAVPALLGMAAFSHLSANKKIRDMREHSMRLVEAAEAYQKALLVIDLAEARSEELIRVTETAEKAFLSEFVKVQKKLFPYGLFSRLLRQIRRFFGGRYFSASDVSEIAYIGQVASRLAKIIDVKVFESDGSVTQGEAT